MLMTRYVGLFLVATLMACGTDQVSEDELDTTEDALFVEQLVDRLPNNFPFLNGFGASASYSTDGNVSLTSNFFTPQGTNGRSCGSCHAPEDGWSVRPATVNVLFLVTGGLHPLFSSLDADRPDADLSTVASRWNSFTMLRQGKFTRSIGVPATRDYDVIGASDPFGVGTTSRLFFFRRPLPTANFLSATVAWDGSNTSGTNLRDGLIRQARSNITGAQQGPPASDDVVFSIVDYEMRMSHAQRISRSVGNLDAGDASGGPAQASTQALVNARFNLFDAWIGSRVARRAQIARGQEIFNNVNAPSGRTCRGCHNAQNNGQNVGGGLFDIGISNPALKRADMAVYTFQSRVTGEVVSTTDPGQGIRTGQFAQLSRFKTPNIRGLAARAPYFHNGLAENLEAVIRHYESALGFVFTSQERADLVAFLAAL